MMLMIFDWWRCVKYGNMTFAISFGMIKATSMGLRYIFTVLTALHNVIGYTAAVVHVDVEQKM